MGEALTPEDRRTGDVVASLAVTLDGFVCRPDGAVDYLDKYQPGGFDFAAWAERVDSIVIGRTSYEQSLTWGRPWGDRRTLVLTSSLDLPVPDGARLEFKSAPTAAAISEFASLSPGRTWVFGGGSVVTTALLGGVVDTLDITIVPEAIVEGIPLFTKPFAGPMRPLLTHPFDNGMVRLVFDTSPGGLRE